MRTSLAPLAENLLRHPLARGDGAVDGGAVAVQLRGFTGEIERVGDRRGEDFARGERVGGRITVSAAGERVGVPIVEIGGFEEIGDARGIGACNARQGGDGFGDDVRVRLAEERIGVRTRAPTRDKRGADGQRRPPGGKNRFVGKQEAGEGDVFVFLPEGLPEAQRNAQHVTDGKAARGLKHLTRFRLEANAVVRLEHAQRHGDDHAAAANYFQISGECVADVQGGGAGLPDDRFDDGIEAELARGIFDASEQMERHGLVAVHQTKGPAAADFLGGGGILR